VGPILSDMLLQRAEEQSTAMRTLQKELDELKETRQREKERESRRAMEDEEELQILRDRLEKLEEERAGGQIGVCLLQFYCIIF